MREWNNEAMKQLNHFDRIYEYAEGQMDAEQRAAFEAELSANKELSSEYDVFLASQKAMEYLAFDELKNITKGGAGPTAKVIPLWRRTWAIAASVLVLIGAGLFWYANAEYSDRRLATDFYIEPNFSPNRGSDDAEPIKKASLAFELGHLGDAIEAAATIHPDSSGYQQAQHIMGHAYFKMAKYERAAAHFSNVVKGEYVNNAAFMKGYSLLLDGQKEAAKNFLLELTNDTNHPYGKRAKAILEWINSPWRRLVF